MGRIGLAFRVFFSVLGNAEKAAVVEAALAQPALPESIAVAKTPPSAPKAPTAPKRSEALTLLAALQREARLVDLVKEPLDSYSDEQIGGAARTVLRDCGSVLERFFSLQPAVAQAEGDSLEVPAGYEPARFHVVGNATGAPPFRGRIVHCGWEAAAVNLPAWTGSNDAARIVAPVEVEV